MYSLWITINVVDDGRVIGDAEPHFAGQSLAQTRGQLDQTLVVQL